jgi:hypothetical protein
MALKAILDAIDDLPDALKSEYVEKDGKFELQVEGMKTTADVARVQEALRKEKSDFSAFKTQFAPLAGKKVEDIVTQLDRITELEAAAGGKLDDNAINTLVENRLKGRVAPIERERDQLKTQLAEKDKVIGEYQGKDKTRAIHDSVRKAATTAKVVPEALEDALILAERHFELDEAGRVVTKDNIGITPGLDPAAWFTDLQQTRKHWWGPNVGGGAGGNRGGNSFTENPFSYENWNMTKQGAIYTESPAKAEQMAKAAGTTVGGQRPPKKT